MRAPVSGDATATCRKAPTNASLPQEFTLGLVMNTGLVGFVTFLLGLLLGNWLAIGRDRRKEFNEAVTPIRIWLLRAKDNESPCTPWPPREIFDRFLHYLRPWQRSVFVRHFQKYRSLLEEGETTDAAGQVHYKDGPEIRGELNALFKYTKRR